MTVPTTRPDYRVHLVDTMPDVAELRSIALLLLSRMDSMRSEENKFMDAILSSNELLVSQLRVMDKRIHCLERWKYSQEDDMKWTK